MTPDLKLNDLTNDGNFRSKVQLTLQNLEGHGEDPKIFETLRTMEEQREKVRRGVSKTMNSYHLKKGKDGKAKAADVASKSKGWNVGPRFWLLLGANCQSRKIGWGGIFGFSPAQKAHLIELFDVLRAAGWPKEHPAYRGKVPISWDPAHLQYDSNW